LLPIADGQLLDPGSSAGGLNEPIAHGIRVGLEGANIQDRQEIAYGSVGSLVRQPQSSKDRMR